MLWCLVIMLSTPSHKPCSVDYSELSPHPIVGCPEIHPCRCREQDGLCEGGREEHIARASL